MSASAKRLKNYLVDPKTLLVIIAAFELMATVIRVKRHFDEMFAAEINPLHTGLFYLVNSFLLLIACVGLRINKVWSYLLAIVASAWLIKRVVQTWPKMAVEFGHPKWSWATVNDWWDYGGLWKWDIPRVFIAILVLGYAMFLLTRQFMNNDKNARTK